MGNVCADCRSIEPLTLPQLAFTCLVLANTILTILVVGITTGADHEEAFVVKAGVKALSLSWVAVAGCLVAGPFNLVSAHGPARRREAKGAQK